MADIELPQLGESVTEGTITRWFKQIGDQVAEDEVLFEVSTDKVDSEVPSPVGGYLTEILVDEGDTVDVGTKLAVVSDSPPADGGGDAEAPAEEPASEPEPERRGGARGRGAGARGRGAGGRGARRPKNPSPRPRSRRPRSPSRSPSPSSRPPPGARARAEGAAGTERRW